MNDMMEKTAYLSATISIIYERKNDETLMPLIGEFLDSLATRGIEVDSVCTVTGLPKLTKVIG